MSKGIKTVAKIALPIAGTVLGSMVGMPMLGSVLGGAVGGAVGGGGIKGALVGALGGYLGSGALSSVAGTPASIITNPAIAGPSTYGSGILGVVTGGGTRALANTVSSAAAQAFDPTKLFNNGGTLMGLGNQLMASQQANTATKAAGVQAAGIDKALASVSPYTQLGQNAVNQINTINADPAGYVQNSPFYKSLAADAERRLLANQAAKGKLGSGETAKALQEQLLTLGNGLVQQQVGMLQSQANTGAAAAGTAADLNTARGDVLAAGKVGATNAYSNAYQNQINTMLALQGLNKTPTYAPTFSL